ncbi:MAG: radical SAM protein [Clostridiaceae bacterium]
MENKRHYIIPIFVPHLGCPFNCVFCNQDAITGSKEKVNRNYVITKAEEYLKTFEKDAVVEISFFGGTFTAIEKDLQIELLKAASEYKDSGKINYIRLSTRPDFIDDSILSYLKEYGVDIIELGVQSMDKDVLFLSGRGHNAEVVVYASNLIKKYGFILGHQMMLGLPGDTEEKDIDTLKQLILLKPKLLRIYPSLVIKDTPMEKMYINKTYSPYSLDKAVKISGKLLKMAHRNNINVIRVGLQPTEEINEGKDLVAGPFHPAFRELAEGYLYFSSINVNLKNKCEAIYINPKEISKLYCDKKRYFKNLQGKNLRVVADESVPRGSYTLNYGDRFENFNIY